MSSKDEKEGSPPGYSTAVDGPIRSENFMTRNGLNLESFKMRDYGHGIVELDRSMKPRHLHMIAIGGSIGAGFFVGSGSALMKGGPGFLIIDFLIIGIMIFNVDTNGYWFGAR
ncbi:hypothetical protein F5Y08DRAFT_19121 [Xylaria arbuscula]|nr:hypothetical protein F5Y08DRAFT_19121 [Xylaria arbuscula]